jgi:Flp pilus assembly protein TadD
MRWNRLRNHSSDSLSAMIRLIAICREEEDWSGLEDNARKLLAVQPLIATGHEGLIEAAKHLGKTGQAIGSMRALQEMEPVDPAGLHFQLAEALFQSQEPMDARIEALKALEFTPRYREAQRLLVAIRSSLDAAEDATSPDAPQPSDGLPLEPSELDVIPPAEGRPPSPAKPSERRGA